MSDTITIKFPRPDSGDFAKLPSTINLNHLEAAPILALIGLVVSETPPKESCPPQWEPGHDCDHALKMDADWDTDGSEDTAFLMAQNTHNRILTPLVFAQMWMFHRTYTLAKKYMTEEQAQEFYHYWRFASDLQTSIETAICEISALVSQNLPAKLASLDKMLADAMTNSGFCCPTNIDAYLRDQTPSHRIIEMEKAIPDFKPEWLSIKGPNAPLERD